jgi:hypothetical protein
MAEIHSENARSMHRINPALTYAKISTTEPRDGSPDDVAPLVADVVAADVDSVLLELELADACNSCWAVRCVLLNCVDAIAVDTVDPATSPIATSFSLACFKEPLVTLTIPAWS